jgi:CheY-like chemotaxis protein
MDTSAGSKTILVVDDNVDFLEVMRVQLEAVGYSVLTADDEAQAEATIAQQDFDLAIVDLMLKNMDGGLVVAHAIKSKDASIPVILVTGVMRETGTGLDAETEQERAWLKADVVLDKPILFDQVQREMDRLLRDE